MSLHKTNIPKSSVSLKSSPEDGEQRPWLHSQPYANPVGFAKDMCIHHLFEQQVQRTPQAIAVTAESTRFTYQQLNRQANRLAYQLSTLGVEPGDLVGICVECSLNMVVGLLAILKAGGAYVPIDPHTSAERIGFILQDTQINVLLSHTQLEPTLTDCLPKDASLICLDRDQWTKMRSCPDLGISVTADYGMCVVYTSETTGQPRRLMTSHGDIYDQMYRRQTSFSLSAQDRVLPNVSFNSAPSVWQILWPLLSGAQLVIPDSKEHQDMDCLVELMVDQDISIVALAPSTETSQQLK